ncbi:MAG: hypothetical protein K2N91_02290, partial [Muribaculaceae bacterium]|nr:hypothetical protein [Muribaculaceae bacterium]
MSDIKLPQTAPTTAPLGSVSLNDTTNDVEKAYAARDLLEVAAYRRSQPLGEKSQEIENLYNELREDELKNMIAHPSRYSKQRVEELVSNGVFSVEELKEKGLITDKSWAGMHLEREYLPDMNYFKGNYDLRAPEQGTDIYFFGMPSSGKTTMLMGISAANGQGYTIDMRTNGGPYAAALRQYTQAGIIPGRTKGNFVTVISGEINEENRRGKVTQRNINLIEMSGEEFALRIAETKEPSLANMGTGVTNILRNDNRKAFFIVIDASRPRVKVSYLDHEIEDDGVQRVKTRYISQLDILDKFIVLMSLPENREIMEKVDAIHFIVTKSDAMGSPEERDEKAAEMIHSQYISVV